MDDYRENNSTSQKKKISEKRLDKYEGLDDNNIVKINTIKSNVSKMMAWIPLTVRRGTFVLNVHKSGPPFLRVR